MQLALSFSTLLASILVLLTVTDNGVHAAPTSKRAAKTITLPLKRIHQNRGDVHPQIVSAPSELRARRSSCHMRDTAPAAAHQPQPAPHRAHEGRCAPEQA